MENLQVENIRLTELNKKLSFATNVQATSADCNLGNAAEDASQTNKSILKKKCDFFEANGFCRFGDSCVNTHPKRICFQFMNHGNCNKGIYCQYLHSQKDCKFWVNGFCRKSNNECEHKHDPAKKGKSTNHSRSKSQDGVHTRGRISSYNHDSNHSTPFLGQNLESLISAEVQKVVQKSIMSQQFPLQQPQHFQSPMETSEVPSTLPSLQHNWNNPTAHSTTNTGAQAKSVNFSEIFPQGWSTQQRSGERGRGQEEAGGNII